ncbi:epidermal growth factor-like protein 8 [Musca vetustissima]|uniref:epidermal growth factor-like protein 8 n=1 Tax=Musca vetustissima TaxID=27455 RepID=UPI002AB665A7|nr:epidermal growth factor-like protein 8 [Musca vetustissima]
MMTRTLGIRFILIYISHQLLDFNTALTITTGHCYKNITVKYQAPVTKTRHKLDTTHLEYYVEMEDRMRVETVRVCCPGFRKILFGLCEPICSNKCPENSYCSEPEKCQCKRGYEESHNHHVRSIIPPNTTEYLECRPICTGGCAAAHTHCVGHNECGCRPGYKDVSSWFGPMRCERIQCPTDQVYDIPQRKCVTVDMDLEQLMQRVARKLAKGLNDLEYEDDDDEGGDVEGNSKRD